MSSLKIRLSKRRTLMFISWPSSLAHKLVMLCLCLCLCLRGKWGSSLRSTNIEEVTVELKQQQWLDWLVFFFEICGLWLSPLFGASVRHAMIVTPRMFFREASVSGEAAGSGGERWSHAGIRGVPKAERRSLDTGVGFHPDLCSSTGGAGRGVIASSLHCSWTTRPHQCKRKSCY